MFIGFAFISISILLFTLSLKSVLIRTGEDLNFLSCYLLSINYHFVSDKIASIISYNLFFLYLSYLISNLYFIFIKNIN